MSAFEADRFNRSRTSPKKQLSVVSSRFKPRNDERDARLTSTPEEFLQNFSGSSCQNASANCHPMVRARMIDHGEQRMNGSCFRIIRAVHQAANSRMNERSGAHCARLNCSKELTVDQAMVTEVFSGLAQCHDL